MNRRALSIRWLLIIITLVPSCFLIHSESRFLYSAYYKSQKAMQSADINQLIAHSRNLSQKLNSLKFLLPDPDEQNHELKSQHFVATLEQAQVWKDRLTKNDFFESKVSLELIYGLNAKFRELMTTGNDIKDGQRIFKRSWFDLIDETEQTLKEINLILLLPNNSEDLNLYLHFALRSQIQELSSIILEEAFWLDQAITVGAIEDKAAGSLVVIRNLGREKRNLLKLLANELQSHNLLDQASSNSLKTSLKQLENTSKKFDDIRRRIYISALIGGDPVDSREWQAALDEFLMQLKYVQDSAAEPIAFLIRQNQQATRLALIRLAGAIAITLFVLALIFTRLSTRILAPVKTITERMGKLAKGDLNVTLPEAKFQDEIGSMIDAISVFKSNALFIEEQRQQLETAKEKAQASERMKSEFLASMSHEIRTPMNGVLGMLSLLTNTSLEQQQEHYVETARSSARSLLSLINDILDFSKIEAGKLELEVIDFNILEVIEDSVAALALAANQKQLEVIVDTHGIKQSAVKGDPTRLRQIITNLLSNAIKFTERGEVVVCARVEQDRDQLKFECSIKDEGIGIPLHKLNTLFDSFTQVDASDTRKYGGTGLGLAIVKKLSELMGGDVSVTSEPGVGSCFTVSLRYGVGSANYQVLPNLDLRGRKILVVDDNATNRLVLNEQLTQWGIEVTEANSGAQALDRLSRQAPDYFDVLILDMQMPEMDGASLGSKIMHDPKLNHAKRIMMTSVTQYNESKFYADHGFAAYFPKPVLSSDLLKALQVVLHDGPALSNSRPLLTPAHIEQLKPSRSQAEKKVLLVEDNEINQLVAVGLLEDMSIEAELAENGVQALDKLKVPQRYDLILMDCQMPEMDGYETTRNIRTNLDFAHYSKVPIIAMTANALKGDQEKCLQVGMDDYISKPVDPEELESKINFWLSQSAQSDQKEPIDEAKPFPEKTCLVEWDKEGALKNLNGNEARLHTLITMYLGRATQQLEQATRLLEANDMEHLSALAHSIKGSSANLGATCVYQAAAGLELAAKENDAEKTKKSVEDLTMTSEQFIALAEDYLQKSL